MTVGALFARLRGIDRGVVTNLDAELAVTASAIPTVNRIYWTRVRSGGAISKVRFRVEIQNGNICIAYARNTGRGQSAQPGAIICTTGLVASPVAGTATLPFSPAGTFQIAAGDWVGIAASNALEQLRAQTTSGDVIDPVYAGQAWREDISGTALIPAARGTLVAGNGRNWLLVGEP